MRHPFFNWFTIGAAFSVAAAIVVAAQGLGSHAATSPSSSRAALSVFTQASPSPEPSESPEASPSAEPSEAPEASPSPESEPTEAPEAKPSPETEQGDDHETNGGSSDDGHDSGGSGD